MLEVFAQSKQEKYPTGYCLAKLNKQEICYFLLESVLQEEAKLIHLTSKIWKVYVYNLGKPSNML